MGYNQINNNINPIVSIVLPTYNRANYIINSINSVLNQTYKNFELIIIDDGSIDNTKNIIKKNFYDFRIKYYYFKKKLGCSYARNKGIKLSSGRYIAFQDSDDIWLPTKLEKQIKLIELCSNDTGVVYTKFFRIENGKKYIIPNNNNLLKEGYIYESLLAGNFIGTPTMLVKRECFERVGMFDIKLKRLIDWDLCLRISKYYEFKFINEPLVISYFTNESISSNRKYLVYSLPIIIKKHKKTLLNKKNILYNHYSTLNNLFHLEGKIFYSKIYKIKSLLLFRKDFRYLIYLSFLLFLNEQVANKLYLLYKKIKLKIKKE